MTSSLSRCVIRRERAESENPEYPRTGTEVVTLRVASAGRIALYIYTLVLPTVGSSKIGVQLFKAGGNRKTISRNNTFLGRKVAAGG